MKVLLMGATGLVGRALCLRLRRDGHELTAWVRDRARAQQSLGSEVQLVSDREDERALESAAGQCEVVINLAGEPIADKRWNAQRKLALDASRRGLTRRLVDAIRDLPASRRPKVLLSASAVGFYGDRGDEVLDESAGGGTGFLADICRDWEHEAERAEQLELRVARFRLAVVLARDGGALPKMLPAFRAGFGGPIGHGRQFLPWIHLDDVLDALASAVVDQRFSGAFNLTAPQPVSSRDFARALGSVLHRPAFLRAPKTVLRLALGERVALLMQSQRAVPRRLEQLGHGFRFDNVDAALRDLLADDATVEIERLTDGAAPESDYLRRRKPRYLLRQQTVLDAPLEQVFAFFSRAENLGALTPPDLAFGLRTPLPIAMHEGTTIDYRIALGPLPLRWRTVIERWEPQSLFVDAQHRGPYRAWWHEHRFRAVGDRTAWRIGSTMHCPWGRSAGLATRSSWPPC